MNADMQKRVDAIVEDEVYRGFRNKQVPEALVKEMEADHAADPQVTVIPQIRFTKLTPRKRRQINEAVVKRYHADLKNKDLLSNAELRKLNVERGEWSDAEQDRMDDLREKTNALMRALYMEGVDQQQVWRDELDTLAKEVRSELNTSEDAEHKRKLSAEELAEGHKRFDRWLVWLPEAQVDFDVAYAKDQGRDTYSPDNDLGWLLDHTPSVAMVDQLNQIAEVKDKLQRYYELMVLRKELMDLQVKHARIFAESVEARRDTAEEMARIYFCTEILGEGDMPAGPITKTFDGMWDLSDNFVQWLMVEIYFFLNNVPDEAREYLETWGFIGAPLRSGSQPSPDGSHGATSSKPDSQPSAETPAGSSAATAAPSSTTPS